MLQVFGGGGLGEVKVCFLNWILSKNFSLKFVAKLHQIQLMLSRWEWRNFKTVSPTTMQKFIWSTRSTVEKVLAKTRSLVELKLWSMNFLGWLCLSFNQNAMSLQWNSCVVELWSVNATFWQVKCFLFQNLKSDWTEFLSFQLLIAFNKVTTCKALNVVLKLSIVIKI